MQIVLCLPPGALPLLFLPFISSPRLFQNGLWLYHRCRTAHTFNTRPVCAEYDIDPNWEQLWKWINIHRKSGFTASATQGGKKRGKCSRRCAEGSVVCWDITGLIIKVYSNGYIHKKKCAWQLKESKKKKKHARSSVVEQEFHPCGARKEELFVLANCPSNKHNHHQNSCGVPGLLKASGPTQISSSDKSPLIS